MPALTWSCHVCAAERPDERISVYSSTHTLPSGVEVTEHVRYCNDRPACIEGARDVSWFEK